MNLTVGPLPPAVYWRRRAIVAGALLAVIVLIVYSCTASGGSGSKKTAGPAKPPSPSPSASTSLAPILGGSPGGSTASASPSVAATQPTGAAAAPPAGDLCTDAEIQLTGTFQAITGGNAPYQLSIRIKNASTRTCKRDVGPDPQELRVVQNGQVLWSSDLCPNARTGSDVRTFQPNVEDVFSIGWDRGRDKCTGGTPVPDGTYQVVARLGTKISGPTQFTLGPTGK